MLNSPSSGSFSIKACLLRAFSAAAMATVYKDDHNEPSISTGGYTITEVLDRINNLMGRFWTKSVIEDLLSDEGTGISIDIGFLLDFASRFNILVNTEVAELRLNGGLPVEDVASGSETCNKIVERTISDLETWTKYSSSNFLTLLAQGKCEFYKPAESPALMSSLIENHSFLVPFYLFFTTGAYSEFREMVKS